MKPAAASAGVALAAGLVCLAVATFAAAATRWYHVEVVIFAQGGGSPWSRDDWREEGPPVLAKNTVELLPGLAPADRPAGSARRHAFRTLPAASLDLGSAVERLDRSDDYSVLMHVGWHQPGFSDDDAPGVHLGTLRSLAAQDRFGAASGEEVEGTVRFWRRRFLHVDVDLAFGEVEAWRQREHGADADAPPVRERAASRVAIAGVRDRPGAGPADDSARRMPGSTENETGIEIARSGPGHGEVLRVVRLTRSLRLRAGRLHYIDHPLFGMLLKVKRLD